MLKRVFLLALVLGSAVATVRPAWAACLGGVPSNPFAHETITVSSASIGFTVATYTSGGVVANYAIATLETNSVRYWPDGTAPTTAVGHLLSPGQYVEVCGQNAVANFHAIRTASPDATLFVTYYKGF